MQCILTLTFSAVSAGLQANPVDIACPCPKSYFTTLIFGFDILQSWCKFTSVHIANNEVTGACSKPLQAQLHSAHYE